MNEEDIPMSAFKDAEAGFRPEGVGKEEVNLREALTIVHPLKKYFNYTLLDIEIKTGRTHQIRTHLKSIGHQLVGDNLYQTKIKNQNEIKRRKEDRQKLNRVFLHAYYLSFCDTLGEQVDFQADIPTELKDFLKDIK
jgi:23S rRNA-/tRNA-specific pseudouridylate synthase